MNYFLIFLLVAGFAMPVVAEENVEESKKEVAVEKDSGKPLSIKEISKQMADIWCLKLEECATNSQMGPKECRKVLKSSFNHGFKNIAKGQKVEVTSGTLSQCSESVKKDTCDALKKAQDLPGCGFIKLLNRR